MRLEVLVAEISGRWTGWDDLVAIYQILFLKNEEVTFIEEQSQCNRQIRVRPTI